MLRLIACKELSFEVLTLTLHICILCIYLFKEKKVFTPKPVFLVLMGLSDSLNHLAAIAGIIDLDPVFLLFELQSMPSVIPCMYAA